MKFGYAWTSGGTPPPEKRPPALPHPPACLQNSNGATSFQRACFRLLAGFRMKFGYLEGQLSTLWRLNRPLAAGRTK